MERQRYRGPCSDSGAVESRPQAKNLSILTRAATAAQWTSRPKAEKAIKVIGPKRRSLPGPSMVVISGGNMQKSVLSTLMDISVRVAHARGVLVFRIKRNKQQTTKD